MSASSPRGVRKREMKLLSLGLPRSGTASMTEALTMLGFEDVHHGVKYALRKKDWEIFSQAADATFPNLPTYTGVPFTRAQWDELYGEHDAAADVCAFFGTTLISVYPEAKVLLVVRDFDSWFRSFDDGILRMWWGPFNTPFVCFVEPFAGTCAGIALRKMTLGLFNARTADEARVRAREAYDRHYRTIRETVPPENLLEYKLGEGWEPLCKFLDRPVPNAPFPWINDAAELKRFIWAARKDEARRAAMKLLPWVAGVAAAVVGLWLAANKTGYL
ncbi:hypothetical protein AURDEDRAFT_61312 [Auricularia subglabra TFB-10046 SS5]|nr:hypothetical protein AURDEDRAFT_61312 [Auricularia subglabra TFB-10046 SS5]